MIMKTTIPIEVKFTDKQVEEFANKVSEYMQDEFEIEELATGDIFVEAIKVYLSKKVPEIIAEIPYFEFKEQGLEVNSYLGTLSFDYGAETIRDMVQECAGEITKGKA